MVGQRLGHYLILEQIGAGGMGVVYRARDDRLQRDVALKVLPPGTLDDPAAPARQLQEARAASALNHPHICTIYEAGEVDGRTYIAMEYVAGASLGSSIPHEGLLTETVLDYGVQVADAIAHAHERGFLHRDLKSANVKVTPDGQVKVLDFGLAQRIREISEKTKTSDSVSVEEGIAGTLQSMAPEVLRGEAADPRTDIWALGVLLHEMAVGTMPFQGRTHFELTTAILREPPAPFPAQVLPGLRAVILRCLEKSPGKRYQHAGEVRAALDALKSNTGTMPPVVGATGRRLGIRAAVAALVLVSCALAVVVVLWRLGMQKSSFGPGGRLVRLLSAEGQASEPNLSPDGKMVVYVADDQGHLNLFLSRVAGGDRVRLTSDASPKDLPRFSPDGDRIAFVRRRPEATGLEICLMPSLGGEAVPLVSNASYPAWSPEGSRLVFVLQNRGEPDALATASADGTDLRVLLRGNVSLPLLLRPAWSPDGKEIAFAWSPGGAARQLWLVPVSGGPPRQLTSDPGASFSDQPVFAPDGGIIHRSNRGGATNLWYLPRDGKPPVQLTNGTGPDESPSVARDGRIAFLNSRMRAVLIAYQFQRAETHVIYSHPSTLWAPAVSPDGQEVAFTRNEPDGSWHIWAVPIAGGTARQLTFGKVPEIYPRYTPDGRFILFFTWREPYRIWRVSRSGGPPAPITPADAPSDSQADVSPDGRTIVFTRTEGNTTHLYTMPLGGGPTHQLMSEPGTVPRWSPDGSWIAFSPDRLFAGGVFVIRADGTGLRRLTDTGGWPVWWRDGKHVGYQAVGQDGNSQVCVVAFEGGESRILPGLRFDGQNFPFDVSPDGTVLLTTNTAHVSDEVWLLEPPGKK